MIWMALAIWVPTRLWMGGVVSPKRDLDLIQSLADKVRQLALCRPLLLAVDGLASYVSAFRDAFRSKFPRQDGETGRCKMVSWSDIYIVQVVKQRVEGVLNVERRIVQGAKDRIESLIQKTQGKGVTPAPTAGAVSTPLLLSVSTPPSVNALLHWHVAPVI
jgi:hypothetical protein